MKRVLFVGEHPFGVTGNSGMMFSLLTQLDTSKYEPYCFGVESPPINPARFAQYNLPITFIPTTEVDADKNDPALVWGPNRLMALLSGADFYAVVFVGIDIWRYYLYMEEIRKLNVSKRFKWFFLFPYDLPNFRADWASLIRKVEFPYVYSKFGHKLLQDNGVNVEFFRPQLRCMESFVPLEYEDTRLIRKQAFSVVERDDFLFGFIGANQVRKDPQTLVKAFANVSKKHPHAKMYMHTESNGVFNIQQTAIDAGIKNYALLVKRPGVFTESIAAHVQFFNSFDCYVLPSMQEGLSWTVLEAMLCGIPVIASETTAHPELVQDGGFLVPCKTPAAVPLITQSGQSMVDAYRCTVSDLTDAMMYAIENPEELKKIGKIGMENAHKWCSEVSDINVLLERERSLIQVEQREAVLFATEASAGDVFMTTRCFKGIKERYGLPLHYMTLKRYMDILKGNPYIEVIHEWNPLIKQQYPFVLDPHAERIVPAYWGRNSNALLSDFYWKLLEVEPDDFFIARKEPDLSKPFRERILYPGVDKRPMCVICTTGGHKRYRGYEYMTDVCEQLKDELLTVQIGGPEDFPAGAEIDLHGKLTYREEAWVVEKADVAITVDTFAAHLCGAFGVSQVTFSGSSNASVVQPVQIGGKLHIIPMDYVKYCPYLGPCSGAVKDCPVPCINRVEPQQIIDAVRTLI